MNDSECIPGRLRRGMCERHYRRWLSTGSTDRQEPRDNLHHYTVDEAENWLWLGARWRNGYARTSIPIHGTRLAHRAFYIEHIGPVPDGMDLDHLCRIRHCVNPSHLEPVNRATNLTRGLEARSLCRAGLHDVTVPGALRPGTNRCIECWRINYRKGSTKYRQTPEGKAKALEGSRRYRARKRLLAL